MPDLYFIFIAVSAVLLVGLSKSGLLGSVGVVGVPLLTLIMPARDAAGMLLPVLLVMDAFAIFTYRRDIDWTILRIMLPGAAIGTLLGWVLWTIVSDAVVLLAVGIITLLFVLDAVLPIRKRLISEHPSRPWGAFWGVVAGLTSFVSHTGGPPYQIYVLPRRLAPTVYSGTTAVFFGIVNLMKLTPYFFLGQLSPGNIALSAMLAPVGIAGVLVGVYLVRRVSVKLFYQLAYGLVALLALRLIWDGASALIGG